MSKISDELRELADTYDDKVFLPKLNSRYHDIADRIDREMMERPLAADGKLLVDGETVYDSNGHEYHVNEVYPLVNVSTSTHSCSMFPDRFTHERPDSFERIADELDEMVRGNHTVESFAQDWERLHELCLRIREQMKEREHE